eukprot:COSAG02_NODE_47291_length_342_cov_0.847737_1_plen_84_part_01
MHFNITEGVLGHSGAARNNALSFWIGQRSSSLSPSHDCTAPAIQHLLWISVIASPLLRADLPPHPMQRTGWVCPFYPGLLAAAI